jgi:hypothetical protein
VDPIIIPFRQKVIRKLSFHLKKGWQLNFSSFDKQDKIVSSYNIKGITPLIL